MFDIGTKVVCVDDTFIPNIRDYFSALPVKGRIYTVRDILQGQHWDLKEEPAVLLVELVNAPNKHGIEPGFQCRRFAEPEDVEEFATTSVGVEEPAWK